MSEKYYYAGYYPERYHAFAIHIAMHPPGFSALP